MYVKFGGISIFISFSFAVFLAVAANITGGRNLLLSLLFSFLHETVHLIFLCFSGLKRAEIRLYPAGIKICSEGMNLLSYRKTVISALSAPVFNLLSGAVFLFLQMKTGDDIFLTCSAVNFILGSINLLPLSFLDGGRALEAILSCKISAERVRHIMNICGIWSLALLFSLVFIGFVTGKVQLFLLFFCVYCLMGTLSSKSK